MQTEKNIKLIITDLDGTLVDNRAANIAAYGRAFAENNITLTDGHAQQMDGMRFDQLQQLIAPGISTETANHIRALKAEYYPTFFDKLVVNTDLIHFLRFMKTQGVKIALASTASRLNGTRVLDHCGITGIIEYTVFGEDVQESKPNPECFIACMNWAAVDAAETLIIEDSAIGKQAATASGATVLPISNNWAA